MRKVFKNAGGMICIFTEEGVSLYGDRQEAFYPYGCMDAISLSLFGELNIRFGFSEVVFPAGRQDRASLREAIKEAKALRKTAPREEAKVYVKCSKVPDSLPPEEQLKQFKHLLSTGTISKGYFDLKKRLLQE